MRQNSSVFIGKSGAWIIIFIAIVLLAAAALLTSALVEETDAASSGTCGKNVTWELDDGGNLTIAGDGAMNNYSNAIPSTASPWGKKIKTVLIKESVTSIGDYAFYMCKSLSSVEIPGSVTSIGNNAFSYCTSLESVEIPGSVTSISKNTFESCTSLKSVEIPGSVTYIGEYAFSLCRSLESVSIPGSVTSIGNSAFQNCTSLTSVEIPDSVTSIGDFAFYSTLIESVEIPGSVASIKEGTFRSCTSLESVSIPGSVTSIGIGAFKGCTSLAYMKIPDSVTSIEMNAFDGITFLDEDGEELPHSAESLAGFEYVGENGVLERFVKDGGSFSRNGLRFTITSLEGGTVSLAGCTGSQSAVTVPGTVEIGRYRFVVTGVAPRAFYGCMKLASVDLGSVSEVGMKAFARCRMLSSVDLGDSLEKIEAYAFYDCVRLKDIGMDGSADDLRSIGPYAFFRCGKISSFAVPSDMEKIGRKAFTKDFADADGGILDATPASLAGYRYVSSGGILVRQPGPVLDTEFTLDGLTYRITKTVPSEVEVVGYSGSPKNVSIPETIKADGFVLKVTSIGSKAFMGCKTLLSISMPSVEKIGTKAFANCSKLADIETGSGLKTVSAYAFYKCSRLSSFDSPDSLKTIGSYAFFKCVSINMISFGTSLTKVGNHAFDGLTFLGSEGEELPPTAGSLCGQDFERSGDNLVMKS